MNHNPEIFGKNARDFDPARYLDTGGGMAVGRSGLKKTGTFHTVLGAESALVATWQTARFSLRLGNEDRVQEGRVRPFFPLGCGWLGGLWADRVSSLGFITYHLRGC